jgi:hypothetical protein
MTKHVLRTLAVISTATLAAGLAAAPAGAADPATTTTFELTAGGLSISAPETADLGKVAVGSGSISGKLGPVKVTDNRGGLEILWTATAESTKFTTGSKTAAETVQATSVQYLPGAPQDPSPATGVFVPSLGLLGGALPLPVYTGLATGNNSVSWNPTVLITLPAQAVAGTYTGTITHSVS